MEVRWDHTEARTEEEDETAERRALRRGEEGDGERWRHEVAHAKLREERG